jgi:nitrogenase molybdenum-iron protein alpha/beta subunit
MTIMHDSSGCNSTYNTHDETRWYDKDSLIFISALSEIEAIMGDDDKLIDDIVYAAQEFKPKFVALASSPMPYMNGTDFSAIVKILEERTGIPSFFVPTNGMHDYVTGAGKAMAEIARRFVRKDLKCTNRRSVNLLGVTPLDFTKESSQKAMRDVLMKNGWDVVSCWAMGDKLETLARAGEAAVNLVVSSVGYEAARVLREMCGTPYVVGTPIGKFTDELIAAMEKAVETGANISPYAERNEQDNYDAVIIGEPVTCGSLAEAVKAKYGVKVRTICPLEADDECLPAGALRAIGEEQAQEQLKDARAVIADPLYKPILSSGSAFYPLPHEAFSGRVFWKSMPDLIELMKEDNDGTE